MQATLVIIKSSTSCAEIGYFGRRFRDLLAHAAQRLELAWHRWKRIRSDFPSRFAGECSAKPLALI
jgi:hypothetical protein